MSLHFTGNVRMRGMLAACIFCLCAAGALAQEKERQTTDKKPLPDAVERKIETKLPMIAARLGGLPEEVTGQLWELKSDLEIVKAARRQLNEAGIDIKGYDYLAGALAGSTRTLVDLEDGRVRRLLLLYPGMEENVARERMLKMAGDAEEQPKLVGENKEIIAWIVDGTQYFAKAVGRWQRSNKGEKGSFERFGAKTILAGPAGIEVGVDAMDWLVVYTCKDKETLADVREGRLRPGMRMIEAYLAMRDHKLYREKSKDGAEKWTWTRQKVELKQVDVVVSEYGTIVSKRSTVEEGTVRVAMFNKDGILTHVENANGLP